MERGSSLPLFPEQSKIKIQTSKPHAIYSYFCPRRTILSIGGVALGQDPLYVIRLLRCYPSFHRLS
eukprot:scaffold13911_cov210-Skeletonema_menzelii.AAC.2